MDRLDAMALFVAAVEQGSLAGAARRAGRSPASVTRAIALLEQLAGETLLLRSTRRLGLTPAGERHLAVWREVLEALGTLRPAEARGPLRGTVSVTAPELFGRLEVLPIVETFLHAQPQVSARLLLVNRLVDLVGEGVDLAVRLAPLADSALYAIRLGEVGELVCASPNYLAEAGMPDSPQDLLRHRCIGLNAEADGEMWPFAVGTRTRSIRVPTRLSVNHAGAAIDAAIRGQGVIRARSYQVADAIAAGRLVRLMPAFEPAAVPVQLLFHPERGRGGAVRAFIDHAVPPLRQALRADSATG